MPKFEEFEQMVENEDGWTDWIIPNEFDGDAIIHSIACCDCGLTHDFEFKVISVKEEKIEKPGNYHIVFKARRNNETTAERREKIDFNLKPE